MSEVSRDDLEWSLAVGLTTGMRDELGDVLDGIFFRKDSRYLHI